MSRPAHTIEQRPRAPSGARKSRVGRGRRREDSPTQKPCEARPPDGQVGYRFDPYWDEVFAAYYDPTMGTCCRR